MALSFRRILACIGIASLLPVAARAQESATISGHVTGEGGIALSGVAVSIPELGLGGITRDDGSFAIAVPSARVNRQAVTVTARRVGYKPKSARVTVNPGTVTQDFVLEANPLQLGEVVVTGAGTATEVEKLGNVRNSVSPELIVKSNEANVVQALAGKAPNVRSRSRRAIRARDRRSRFAAFARSTATSNRCSSSTACRRTTPRSRRRTSIRSTPGRRRASADRTSADSSRERRRRTA